MLLRELMERAGLPWGETQAAPDTEVTLVTCDSRQVGPGAVFVCIQGGKADGHCYAAQAAEKGAAAVVAQHDVGLPCQLLWDDTRFAYARLCAVFHGEPAKRLKLVAVTGTNGKTTITYLMKHVLEQAGHKVGIIGTVQNEIGSMGLPAKHTTPDPAELHALFARMERAGCDYVVLEASSHALDQQRLAGCWFEAVIFTNLTQDHLDYHHTMEAYYEAKKKAFSMTDKAVVNFDDPYGKRLAQELQAAGGAAVSTYSVDSTAADYSAQNVRYLSGGVKFAFLGQEKLGRVSFGMPGAYSVSNALATGACALALGLPFDLVMDALSSCEGVRGRMEVLPTGTDFTVIIDYAHSPDGLEKSLAALSQVKTGRLVALFGCAGERDRAKRKLMASAVAKYADFVVFTSDNPRSEDPMQIIEDAMPGFEGYGTPLKVIPDRFEAILWALQNAQKGDLLLLAGKGHEDYQVLADCTIYFDEHVIVQEMVDILKKDGKLTPLEE